MVPDLATAIRGLSLEDQGDFVIDDILFQQRPRKRVKQNPSQLKTQLETRFLTPDTQFSSDWLNRLQQ